MIVARDYGDWKSGSDFLNQINFPIPQDRVYWAAPRAAEALAFPERQVINHASCEVVIELDFRESPIRFRGPRQGPVGSARAGTEAIRKSRVEVSRIGVPQEGV